MSSDDDSDYSSDDDHYVEEVEPEELPQQDAGERRVLGGVDDVFGGGGEAEQPAANPLRQCVDFLVALPPFTRAWLVVLVLTACATWYLGDKHPRGKRMLALHWGRALGPKREWWRLLTTFGTLGGQEASVRSLMACGMIYESLAPHEHNMRALGRYRRFGACVVVSAALLLGSQYFGVRRRWYALAFQRAGAADWANTVGASYFLSHDLIFCLLCAPCWEHPHLQINLAFLPGVGPFRMWQLPFVLASVQVLIGGSVRNIYAEAIVASVVEFLLWHIGAAAFSALRCLAPAAPADPLVQVPTFNYVQQRMPVPRAAVNGGHAEGDDVALHPHAD